MTIEKYRHPFLFYGLATAIPWLFWFGAAYLSRLGPGDPGFPVAEQLTALTGVSCSVSIAFLMIAGLFSPMIIAFWMMAADPDLRNDLLKRVFVFKTVSPFYLLMTCFLMLASILLAQAVSLLFGHSAGQFALSGQFSFSAGLLPVWFLLFLAPVVEELAWHSYGTDCLRRRVSLFATCIIFAVFWALWHFPLSFIKDYYHSNLAETSWIYSLNFSLSLIPYVLLMNWLYYKTGRNIMVAIVFHLTAGFFNEIFATHPDSKVIQTGLLLALSIFLVIKDRDFFFKRRYPEKPETTNAGLPMNKPTIPVTGASIRSL